MKLPSHLSYSSLNTFISCPRSYYLSRMKNAEAVPAWYFAVGSALHLGIELMLKSESRTVPDIEQLFYNEVSKSMAVEPDTSKWLYGGAKDDPIKEERALKLALDCFERACEYLEDIEVWEVEPDITGYLPGCSLPIKAFPDLLGAHKKNGPVILDWKTGARPKSALQLEIYNALLGVKAAPDFYHPEYHGMWALLRPGSAKDPRPIKFKETPSSIGAMFGEVERRIGAGAFPALPGKMCDFCSMKTNCKLMSGSTERTRYYDTPEKDGMVPF